MELLIHLKIKEIAVGGSVAVLLSYIRIHTHIDMRVCMRVLYVIAGKEKENNLPCGGGR